MADYTIRFPFDFSNVSNGFETINETNINEMVIFNLKNIILTNPGERIMDANFGVGIKRFLFEQETRDFGEIEFIVKSQVKRYAPYINILDMQMIPAGNNLNISIRYEVPKAKISGVLDLEIEL